jgi:hypothetical protein
MRVSYVFGQERFIQLVLSYVYELNELDDEMSEASICVWVDELRKYLEHRQLLEAIEEEAGVEKEDKEKAKEWSRMILEEVTEKFMKAREDEE